jgi:hypothetical protein
MPPRYFDAGLQPVPRPSCEPQWAKLSRQSAQASKCPHAAQACTNQSVRFGGINTAQRGPLAVTGNCLPLLHIHKGRGHAGAVKYTTREKHLL